MSRASFEIFGFDFIVDSDYRTWLIEVNTNPDLSTSSSVLKKLVPRMVNDALKLTID
jgi:tubulin---tyrosine ligase